jgi:hypothetical protein
VNGTGHVLVVGVDGVRFDLLGPDSTPSIRALGQQGFLALRRPSRCSRASSASLAA